LPSIAFPVSKQWELIQYWTEIAKPIQTEQIELWKRGYTYHELHTKGEHEKYSKFQALSAHFFLFVKNEAIKKCV
jgi:hypothetical protein